MKIKVMLSLGIMVVVLMYLSLARDNETTQFSFSGIANPAAVYCEELGYNYSIVRTEQGEKGICLLPDNKICSAWEFLQGTCGKKYSYCKKLGYDIQTVNDGQDPFSPEYAVCIVDESVGKISSLSIAPSGRKAISVTDLMNLPEKVSMSSDTKVIKKAQSKKSKDILPEKTPPSAFDWRNKDGKNWLTPVKAQGNCGSCWAFASVGGVESKIKISRNDPSFDVDLSEQYLVADCSSAGHCGGGSRSAALQFIQENGIPDELCFPYQGADLPCSNRCGNWNKRLWQIDGYTDYYRSTPDEEIKNSLVEKGPLPAGMLMDGYFDSNGIYRCNNPGRSPHAIVIVGYNDYGNYWIVRNSWGSGWNGDGYFKIGYGECDILYTSNSIELLPVTGKLVSNSVDVCTGYKSGSLVDTYYNDGIYMTLSEDCHLTTCNGLDVKYSFPTETLVEANSIDLIAHHRARWENGFSFWHQDKNNGQWSEIEGIPNSQWYLMKYNLCNSPSECLSYTSGNALVDYLHPSCSFCDIDYVDVDLLYLEFSGTTITSCFTGGVSSDAGTFCCGEADDICPEWFQGVICDIPDPDCCPDGGFTTGGGTFCCGVNDGICPEDFAGVSCIGGDPDC